MAEQETEIVGEDVGPLRKQFNLFLGVWSQFWYVGAQVAIAGYFINYCKEAGKTAAQGCKFRNSDSNSHSVFPANTTQPISSPSPKASTPQTASSPQVS